MSADRQVLLDLHDTQFVVATLRLHGKNVVRSLLIHAYVNLICLYLPHIWSRGSEMVLQRVASDSGEDVHQSVVPDLS